MIRITAQCETPSANRRKKVLSSQFSVLRAQKGFTLIEFLVVLGLLVMTIGSTLLFLTSILKGSNKSTVTAEAKQNGQVVLDSLERQIRNAIEVLPAEGQNLDEIVLRNGTDIETLYIKCIDTTPDPNSTSDEGWIGSAKSDVAPSSNAEYQPITNKDNISGVDIENCFFDVEGKSSGGTSPQIVKVRFTVNQGEGAPSRKDFEAKVELQTSISLRRYNN